MSRRSNSVLRSRVESYASLTGLTRDRVWHVENGRAQSPVRNFRYNHSLLELLAPGSVDSIGEPERVASSEGQGNLPPSLPALEVKAFHFTSQSVAV